MPRLKEMEEGKIPGGNFTFSGIRTEHLGASEYTLATMAVDITGSVSGFEKELRQSLITMVKACKKSPRADNLLVRVILFSDSIANGVQEVHGFKPLGEINPDDYEELDPNGGTPLFDAVYSAVGATNAYAKKLYDDDFLVNAIITIITDGADNASTTTPQMIKKEIEKGVKGEFLESIITILVAINAAQYIAQLDRFKKESNLDHFIDAGDVTERSLAKLADFVSQSISSQSQSLGTGGPSQNISTTI